MKAIDVRDESVRCRNCECNKASHTQEGKCLYGPGTYEPWRCDHPHCCLPKPTGLFLMCNNIHLTKDGRCLHGPCADDLGVGDDAVRVYGVV